MANIKISELTALTPPDAADLVPVTDSSASQTKRTTVGEIVGIINGDVDVANDGTATISELPVSKLQDGDSRQLLQTDATGTGVEWTSNVDVPGTLDVTGAATLDGTLNVAGLASLDGGIDVDGAFTVANTSGNIATSGTLGVTGQSTLASAAVSDLTSGRVVLAGTSGELEDSAGLTFNGTQLDVDGDAVIIGNLAVNDTSTGMPLLVQADGSRNAIQIVNNGPATEEGRLYWYASDKTTIRAAISGDENGLRFFHGASVTEQLRITSDRYARLASGTGGIQFNGDTAAANALDDYEEGTWTPSVGRTSTFGTYTPGPSDGGKYTKIGNVVYFSVRVDGTNTTASGGNWVIRGLPFTSANNTSWGRTMVSAVDSTAGSDFAASGKPFVIPNSTDIDFGTLISGNNVYCAGFYYVS